MKPLFIIVAIALCGAVAAMGEERPPRKYAIVVGVRQYREGQPLPELPFAQTDAEELDRTFAAGDYQTVTLSQSIKGERADVARLPTAANIRDQLRRICENPYLGEQDTVIVALAGHGVLLRVKSDDKGTLAERYFFCPMDADLVSLVNDAKEGEFHSSTDVAKTHALIPIDEIYEKLHRDCKAGLKLMFVDACRNDPSRSDGKRALESVTLPPIPSPPGGIGAFYSCSQHQKAVEDKDLKHGVFFHYVIQGLRGEADYTKDGKVTWSELNEYVGGNVYDFVAEKHKSKQTPEQKGEIRGRAEIISVRNRSITNSLGMKLVLIPAGKFTMGSAKSEQGRGGDENPIEAAIAKPFYMSVHEVTQGEYSKVSGDNPSWFSANGGGKPSVKGRDSTRLPVESTSWEEAVLFCEKLSAKEGKKYRLPTEAEWEYACRAGTATPFAFGDRLEADSANAAIAQASDDNSRAQAVRMPAAVGGFRPNPFGLCDMHGNVAEWCLDWYSEKLIGGRDPVGAANGQVRVVRGGSYEAPAMQCRSAHRDGLSPDFVGAAVGFRIVMEQAEGASNSKE